MKDAAGESDSQSSFLPKFFEYIVQEVIFDPKVFLEEGVEEKTANFYIEKYNLSSTPESTYMKFLPRNTIIARQVSSSKLTEESDILFPLS